MIEADELWRLVRSKACFTWVWAALDADTRRVVAMVVGDRSEFTAHCLWDLLPAEDREHAVFYTDFLPRCRAAVPAERHAAAGKEEEPTAHVERFWLSARQPAVSPPGAADAVVPRVPAEPRQGALVLRPPLQQVTRVGRPP